MNPKKWQSIHGKQGAKTCIVHVDIGSHNEPRDHVSNLLLKQAKEVLKDALIACAERHDGKLDSWKDHSGTFLFLADDSDGYHNCCVAAVQMLHEVAEVTRVVRLSDDLEGLISIRIVCDAGPIIHGPEPHTLAVEFIESFKKHGLPLSAGNRVTITESVFRQLREPLKSRFLKSKRSAELGIDYYASPDYPFGVGPATADLPKEPEPPMPVQPTQAVPLPVQGGQSSSPRERMLGALKSRAGIGIGAVVALCLCILALVRFWPAPPPPATPPLVAAPQYPELVQSEAWRTWRQRMHEKLSGDKVTESTIADALKIELPARPEPAGAALRRDQAVGEVLMAYPPVRNILWDRFGIDEKNFLGTGMSKPSSASNNYGTASVHEYLIKNYYADSTGVWMRTLDPINMSMTVSELFDQDRKPGSAKNDPVRQQLVREIDQRVKDRATTMPAVIRFARLNASEFSRKLGKPNRRYVFASNLAEVWNLSVQDAANLSGYISPRGDTVYILAFLPGHAADVVPATWDQVLNLVREIDKD